MQRLAVLSVALLAVLAGCGGTGGPTTTAPGSPSLGRPATGTTPSTGTTSPTVTPPDGPQGISETSVNETELVRGHRAALKPRSYRLTLNRSGRLNDSFRQWTSAGRVPLRVYIEKPSATSREYYVRMSTVGMKRNGVMHYANSTASNGTYVAQAIPGGIVTTPVDYRVVGFVLPLELTPDGTRTVDGRTYRVLTASGTSIAGLPDHKTYPTDYKKVTSYDATVLVDKRGFIASFEASYQYSSGRNQTVSAAIDRVGSTSVTEPAWLCEARAQTKFRDDC